MHVFAEWEAGHRGYDNKHFRVTHPNAVNGKDQQTMFKIYTKTGDKGTSATIAGDRRPKDDHVFEALGATDELTSSIGLAREFCKDANLGLEEELVKIQCIIQDAGSNIATPKSLAAPNQLRVTQFDGSIVQELETWIDSYTSDLPPLKNFILPGGGKSSACLHISRSICRRAERRISPLIRDDEIDPESRKVFKQ
ncbi:putative cob(I)yrinic acid a,c-diamide adenosyltransferase, mitochondrial, partial [Apostichopus japonicus]